MSNRYEVRKVNGTIVLIYKYGYTKVECNDSTKKTIVINAISDRWIEEQYDRIFGLKQFKKFSKHIYMHRKDPNPQNPHSIKHTLVANYIPKSVIKDFKHEGSTKFESSNLIEKYFKK